MIYEFCTKRLPYDEAVLAQVGPEYEGEMMGYWHPAEDGGVSTKYTIRVGWSDNPPHLTPEMKRKVMLGQKPFMRVAREEGYPVAGTGRIYPIAEERLAVPWFAIPDWWGRLYAVDPGWGTTAALFLAYDADADVIYVTNEYYQGQKPPFVHARALLAYGADWMPGVLDPYATGKLYDGKQMVDMYVQEGLDVVAGDDYGVQRGTDECYGRMETGRLKVFAHCRNFFWELGLYQADDSGKPDKRKGRDHLMDAMRIGVASIARAVSRTRYASIRSGEAMAARRALLGPDRPWETGHWRREAADKIAGF